MKEKYGKTLLVVLSHGTETIDVNLNYRDYLQKIMDDYMKEYDTFFLCGYWTDVNDDIFLYAEQIGYVNVCTGFRFDPLFIRRQRALFELVDAVIIGDPSSTALVYAVAMNKPVCCIPATKNIEEFSRDINYQQFKYKHIADLQIRSETMFTNDMIGRFGGSFEDCRDNMEFCNRIFGLSYVRDSDYIRNMVSISKDIYIEYEVKGIEYSSAVIEVFNRYRAEGKTEKMIILRAAISDSLNL